MGHIVLLAALSAVAMSAACRADGTPGQTVLVHRFESLEALATAPAGARVLAGPGLEQRDGRRGGKAVYLPPDGATLAIDLPEGLNPRQGTLAFWFTVYNHPKWQLETTPLVTLLGADGQPVHVIRRTEATVHCGAGGKIAYTQTADAFYQIAGAWRHAALTWDADGSDVATPRGVVRFFLDARPVAAFYLDLQDGPITKIVIGGQDCDSAVDDLVVLDRPLLREAIRETELVDTTLAARIAASEVRWGPQRIAIARREQELTRLVRAAAVTIEAEGPLQGGAQESSFRPERPWGKPDGAAVKDAFAADPKSPERTAMSVAMAVPREYQSQANVASGNAYRAMTTDQPLTWTFEVPTDDAYAIVLRYAIPREWKPFDTERTPYYPWRLLIDGNPPIKGAEQFDLPQTGGGYDPIGGDMSPFKYWAVGNGRKVQLAAGRHTVTVQNLAGKNYAHGTYCDDKTEGLDCIVLTTARVTNPAHPEHLADYQRVPQMWVEDCRVTEEDGRKRFAYTVLMRSRSDAPATYDVALDTESLSAQKAELDLDGRTVALGPGAEQRLVLTFTTSADYIGTERCLVRLWQLENRTRFNWWMWNPVSDPGLGSWPRLTTYPNGYFRQRDRYDKALVERLSSMTEQELKAMVPKWPHLSFGGFAQKAGAILTELGDRATDIDVETLEAARALTDDNEVLANVRGQLAARVWEFHGGRGSCLRDLRSAWRVTGEEKYAATARTIWSEIVRSYNRRIAYAYMIEYREDMRVWWGDPWGSGYPSGFGLSHVMNQTLFFADAFFASPAFTARDRLQIQHNLMLRAARLAMCYGRGDDLGYASLGGQMGWQEMPELARVLGNDWFVAEFVKCIKNNLAGFADDGVDTSNWISSYGGAYADAITALDKVPDAGAVLNADPAFARKLHAVATAWSRASFSNGMPIADHDGGAFGWLGQIPFWVSHGPIPLEWAAKTFGDTKAERLLKHLSEAQRTKQILSEERTRDWLDETLPSVIFPDTGLAVLHNRSGSDDPRDWIELYMDYGQGGGPHGHPAKLHVLLYGHNTLLARDWNYGSVPHHPVCHSWAKTPNSHNTVVADHRAPGANGRVNVFANLPRLNVLDVTCDRAWGLSPDHSDSYASRRVLMLADRYYLDFVRVASPRERTYTWLWHNWGKLDLANSQLAGPKLEAPALWISDTFYQDTPDLPVQISDIRKADASKGWEANWDFSDRDTVADVLSYANVKAAAIDKAMSSQHPWMGLAEGERVMTRLVQLGAPGAFVEGALVPALFHKAPKRTSNLRCWQVFATRRAKETVFATVFETYRTTPRIAAFEGLGVTRDGDPLAPHQATAVRIGLPDGRQDIVLVNFGGGTAEVPAARLVSDASHVQVVHQDGAVVRIEVVGGTHVTVGGKKRLISDPAGETILP